MDTWARLAIEHWQGHPPVRHAELEGLDGVNPNDGTIGWPEFLERVAQADQTVRSVVEAGLIDVAPDGVPAEGVA